MRSFRPTTASTRKNNKEKLVFVRESVLYGLVIENAKVDKTSINRGIVSTPTMIFYSNNTRCLIDYTNQTNFDIEGKLNEYFSQIDSGTTLNIFNGNYTDTNSNTSADLTGQYTFRSYHNGIIEAEVISVSSLSTTINRYDKTRFDEIPFLVASTITDGNETRSLIKNKLGKNTKNSFNYLGVKVGDYIKISDVTSQLKVLELNMDSDGNEYIIVDRQIDEIDLTDLKTKVDLYIAVTDPYTVPPDLTETKVGACIEYSGGVIISCTDNHTSSQCRFRTNTTYGITTEITLGTFCATPETDTAVQRDTTDNLVQLTTTLANAMANMNTSSGVAGVINKSGNTKNGFYGRPF
jgi:hypothetical protein